MFIKLLRKIANASGYEMKRKGDDVAVADIKADGDFMSLFDQCRPYTMTSIERLYSLYQSINYIVDHEIQGDLVECGVWKGGSSMMMALTLLKRKDSTRKIFLYDTYEGMSEPTEADRTFIGENASDLLKVQNLKDPNSIWCYSSLEEVKQNLSRTKYSGEKLVFVKGKVEDTLSQTVPGQLALLRLDTDWYESTKIELEVLYPLLKDKGILIIDDFGHWEGAKKAVREYFRDQKPLLHRIDNTGRIMIK
jgi:O-methyltransferase